MNDPRTEAGAGEVVDGEHRFGVRVYFEDTDTAHMVYHANFLKFMERARTEILRLCGVDQFDLLSASPGDRMGFAVRRCEIDFLSPGRLDQKLEVRTALIDLGAAYVDFRQRVVRDLDVLADAFIRVACLGPRGRPRRIPREMASSLEILFATKPNKGAA